jgi:uncharacterized protein (TIGR03067 family)
MQRLALIALLVVFSSARAAEPEDRREFAKDELEQLRGEWVLTSMETEGHTPAKEAIEGRTSEYRGDLLTLKSGGNVRRRSVVTVDPTRTPKAINTWDLDGPFEDQTVPGIYELKGDMLRLCFARPGEKRPTEFTTKSGSGFLFVVYRRKKP